MPSKPRNRIGEVYGRLTIVKISDRRSSAGNAYWWCNCTCGNQREVPTDSLSNKIRKKKNVTECLQCARNLANEGVRKKNEREEKLRREEAIEIRKGLTGKVPENWLQLPLTDAHARELGVKHFFRGKRCLKGHISPYRINGGCLACSKKNQSRNTK